MKIKYDKLVSGTAEDIRCTIRCWWQNNHSI